MGDYVRMILENEENAKEIKNLKKQNAKLKKEIAMLKKEIKELKNSIPETALRRGE